MNLKSFIGSIRELPASPEILFELQRYLANSNTPLDAISSLVHLDPSLTAGVIRYANSAASAPGERCEHLADAISRIGFRNVFNLISAVGSSKLLTGELPVYHVEAGELWRNSVTCALAMERLAPHAGVNPQTAHTIGILHGIGRVVVDLFHREHCIEGYREIEQGLTPEIERQILGFDNGEVAAQLLIRWRFAPEIYVPIHYQHQALQAPEYEASTALLAICACETAFNKSLHQRQALLEICGLESEAFAAAVATAHEEADLIIGELMDKQDDEGG